jgi:predicted Zn-dependent protease
MNYIGYMLAERNTRLDEAEQFIQKALQRDPNNGAFLDSLGWVYFRMNKLNDAESNLRRALQHMSTDPTVHDHLGDVLFHQGKIKDAITHWQNSLKQYAASSKGDQDPEEEGKIQKKLEGARVRLARESSGARDEKQP